MAHRYSGHRDKDDDDDYDYSDSFISDEDDESVKKHTTRKVAQVTARKKPPAYGRGHKNRMSSRATSQSQEPKLDNAVQRMLSSKNLRINELKNQMEDLRINMVEMKEENKLLRKTQKRQEKALNKFENEESDLPQLLQRHNNEVRTLREQFKKAQDKYQRTDRYLRDAEDELEKTKSKLKKYKNLVEDKDLLERQDLQKKLQQAEIDLEERDVKVRDLEKHINHLNKNHRHELGIEIARHRDLQRQIEGMRKDTDDLQTQLKEKVKAAELANIYSLRKGKKLPASYSGTPNRTPPPMNARKRHPSLHDLTPREKMKMYEDKRKDEEKLHREKKQRASRQKEKITASSTFLTESHEYYPSQPSSDRSPKNQERQKRDREEQQRQRAEEEDRRRQREREEQELRELEELEVSRRQREAREREEKRKRDQESEDWMKKMETEKRQREVEEQRVRDEQQRKEREERDRRERERQEQERRAKEEKDRMMMDSQLAEERMKKDELLRKLRMIDEGQNKPEEKKSSGNELFFATSSKARRDSEGSATSSKKSSYSFTKPVENMHHGKPAREDVTVPYIERQKKQQAESPVSGYQPSFGLSSGITGTNKKTTKKSGGQVIFGDYEKEDKHVNKSTNRKSDLMADLFGNSSSKPTRTTELDNDDIFKPPVRNTKTNATKTSGFPWEDDNKKSTTVSNRGERASSLFGGGGSGILDDNEPSVFDSSKLLPKRGKHTGTTFQSKPVVSAIDHMDDDIEEVIL